MATYQCRQEPLTTCPYNPAHQVKLNRLQIHITKCKKAYREKDMKHCPFSAEHVVPASELMHHIYTCPNNTTVERFLTAAEKDIPTGNVVMPAPAEDVPTEENWDEETSGSTKLEDKIPRPSVTPVFVNVQAMAPAERRHYYASLHSQADELLPNETKPGVSPQAEEEGEEMPSMPPMPKTESKVLLHMKAMEEALQKKYGPGVLGDDSDTGDSDDESDELFKNHVHRMGLGRGYASAAAANAKAAQASNDDLEAEVRSRMKLMGLGRGRPLPRN